MVNAIVQTAFAKALDEANRVDELISSENFDNDPRYSAEKVPFLGVPITCKEIIFVKVGVLFYFEIFLFLIITFLIITLEVITFP